LLGLVARHLATSTTLFTTIMGEMQELSSAGFEAYYAPWQRTVKVYAHVVMLPADSPQSCEHVCWLVLLLHLFVINQTTMYNFLSCMFLLPQFAN
jgi:hypothetical protein